MGFHRGVHRVDRGALHPHADEGSRPGYRTSTAWWPRRGAARRRRPPGTASRRTATSRRWRRGDDLRGPPGPCTGAWRQDGRAPADGRRGVPIVPGYTATTAEDGAPSPRTAGGDDQASRAEGRGCGSCAPRRLSARAGPAPAARPRARAATRVVQGAVRRSPGHVEVQCARTRTARSPLMERSADPAAHKGVERTQPALDSPAGARGCARRGRAARAAGLRQRGDGDSDDRGGAFYS